VDDRLDLVAVAVVGILSQDVVRAIDNNLLGRQAVRAVVGNTLKLLEQFYFLSDFGFFEISSFSSWAFFCPSFMCLSIRSIFSISSYGILSSE